MSALWIVSNLSILNIESLLRPVGENSGWLEVSRKSAFPIGLDTIEEMKAIIISFFCGLEEMMTAGRTLEEVRSAKGNGMSMMSPRLRTIGLDFFSIKERVDVFFWIIQESEAFRTLSEFTNEHRRDFIIIDSNSNEYFLVFGQLELQVPTEFESTMFINCRNQLSHYNSPLNKDTTFSLESQERATFCDYNYKTKLKKYFVSILTHTNIFDSILVQITRKQCVGIESHLVLAIVAQIGKALKFEEKRKRELSDEIEGFIFTIDLSEAFKKEILKISFSIKENQHQKIISSPILTEFRIQDSEFSIQDTKYDLQNTIHERRYKEIAASGVEIVSKNSPGVEVCSFALNVQEAEDENSEREVIIEQVLTEFKENGVKIGKGGKIKGIKKLSDEIINQIKKEIEVWLGIRPLSELSWSRWRWKYCLDETKTVKR